MSAALPPTDLASLRSWFASYCASFRCGEPELQRNFDLKELHSRNVCEAARLIALEGEPRRLMLAQVAALCHDLGRFPQFRDFRTFKDGESLNHAHLSGEIARENDLLGFLSRPERDSVTVAIRLHNVFEVPAGLPAESHDLLKIVRDADKIDIWRVFVDFFHSPEEERASGAGLGFPDLPGCSPEVLAAVGAGEMVRLPLVKSLNDFKLLQLSWVYDINFRSSLELIRQRGVLEQLAATLPAERAIREVVARVREHLERGISS